MSASTDIKRLVNEIATAKSDRGVLMNSLKENFNRIKQDTAGLRHESVTLMKSMGRDRKKMTQSLRRQLDSDKRNFGAMEKKRSKEAVIDHNKRIHSIKESKNILRSDLNKFKLVMRGLETDRQAGTKEDKAQRLAGIKTMKTDVRKMQEDTQASLKQIHISQKKMGDAISSFLKAFVSDVKITEKSRKSEVKDFLGSVKAEMSALSSAWGEVYSNVGINESKAVQEDTASEPEMEMDTVSEPDMEKDVGEDPEEQMLSGLESETNMVYGDGPIKEKVMSTLVDYADGLKMTQMAELLDIEQWRILIPVMRDLRESSLVRKEGPLYFTI